MSRSWGFDLDMTAIRLMRLDGDEWTEVTVEKIDGPDIEDRLMAMVDQIDQDVAVTIFLPKDQILYTDVDISSPDAAQREIEAAMDGRTPYPIDELKIDWEQNGNSARVAAIACETLDEAFAFAEARGLSVSKYASLANSDDFPRLPDFGGPDVLDESEAVETVPFSSMREGRVRTEPIISSDPNAGIDSPVVDVADDTPVMQVKSRPEPPLNPGAVLNPELAAPRVSTDIAASTVSDEVGATLTPPKQGVRVRSAGRAVPTLLIFAAALLLTIGIAFVVWSVLPLAPQQSSIDSPLEPAASETAVLPETPQETAELLAEMPVIDLPVPTVQSTDITLLATPEIDFTEITAPASQVKPPLLRLTPVLASANALRDTQPLVADAAPLPPRPEWLVELPVDAPQQSPDPRVVWDESTNRIYIASIEQSDLAFDAIALPNQTNLLPGSLPSIDNQAPALLVEPAQESTDSQAEAIERAVLASIDPDLDVGADDVATDEITEETVTEDPAPESATPALQQTELARALPDRAPRARPSELLETIERRAFGGRTRAELATVRPSARPESEQMAALQERADSGASELAVATSLVPRNRPGDFDAIVAQTLIQREAARVTAALEFDTPDTSSAIEAALADDAEPEVRPQDTPRLSIPSSASVARQATIDNAIKLNRINLVGVYGAPSDRRALVRLSSGRYVKVKVGDKIDGGTVAEIKDKELLYRKGRRTLSLEIPQG